MHKSIFLSALAEQGEIAPGYPDGYFPHWEHNVYGGAMPERFLRMFLAGSGSELICKACAKHSSSMLAYNFFHWVSEDTPLEFFDLKFTDVAFEVRLPCLLPQFPANLDIALIDRDHKTILFLESKFTEYFHNCRFEISKSYEGVVNCSWLVESYRRQTKKPGVQGYYDGIKQNICHLIALDRLMKQDEASREMLESQNLPADYKVCFANIVFEPDSERFKNDHVAFANYKSLFESFVEIVNGRFSESEFFLPKGSGFLTYRDIWNQSAKSMPRELRAWLDCRYMQFSASSGTLPVPKQF